MKKRNILILTGIMALGLAACGKGGNTFDAGAVVPSGYQMTVSIRENSMVKNDKAISFIYSPGTENMPYEVWYGTEGGNSYYKADSDALSGPVGFIDGTYEENVYDDFWTHEEISVPFEAWTEVFNGYYTAENFGNLTYTGEAEISTGRDETLVTRTCSAYHADATGDIGTWLSLFDREEDITDETVSENDTEAVSADEAEPADTTYTAMSADVFVNEGKVVYLVMEFTGTEGYNATVSVTMDVNIPDTFAVAEEDQFMTFYEYKNKAMDIAMNEEGETAFDIAGISAEDIENQTADGFYYDNGTFTYTSPTNDYSWKHIVGGEVVEEFDKEANTYVNYETGEKINEVVKTVVDDNGNEYTTEESIYEEESLGATPEGLDDMYSLTLNQINVYSVMGTINGKATSWKSIFNYYGYEDIVEAHPEIMPEEIQTKAETIYNTWTLQDIIDKIKGNKLSENEKYIVSYIASTRNFYVASSDMASISLRELFIGSGLDVDGYASKINAGQGPWIPDFSVNAYTGASASADGGEDAE